jgi:hypothetical protein
LYLVIVRLRLAAREAELAAVHAPVQYARIRGVNLGDPAPADELIELELGKNECAMSRR